MNLPFVADTPRGRRHFPSSYQPVPHGDGAPTGLVAAVAEHSPSEAALRETLRENEAQLRAREAQLHTVLQQPPVGAVIADEEKPRQILVNPVTNSAPGVGSTFTLTLPAG